MFALRLYLIISVAAVLILNNFFEIFRQSYSVWLVPLLVLGILIVLLILQAAVFLLMIATTNLNGKPGRGQAFFRFLVINSLQLIAFFGRVKIRASGLEKLPEDKKMLFVCNHQHDFDPVIMLLAFPDYNISFIGKKDIYTEKILYAKAMHRLDCLPIDRENDREAAKTIISAIKFLTEDKHSVGLFPEGYTSKTGELLPFRNGSFKIALKSKAPVAVCVLNNTKSIPKNLFRRKTVVDFRLLDVIYAETYESMNTVELGDIIHKQMEEALKDIKK
ncbi:MAG: lysophospholipid acyltransferase family protein [Acutalibacteraceae bacterium]|jgi:1-acyl-sn-glycerol-3-phosphate acyltransferase